MHQTATHKSLSSEGYFFSSLPFSHTEQIESLQLAIVLGDNDAHESEVILTAHSADCDSDYKLALVGHLQVVDGQGDTVEIESLRHNPIEALCQRHLEAEGYRIISKPYFIWLRGQEALLQSKSYRIYSSVYHQLKTLNPLM